MKSRWLLLAFPLACVLSGCGSGSSGGTTEKTAPASPDASAAAPKTNSEPGGTVPAPDPNASKPGSAAPGSKTPAKPDPKAPIPGAPRPMMPDVKVGDVKILDTGQGHWVQSPTPIADFAKNTSKSIAGMRGVYGEAQWAIQTTTGIKARGTSLYKIQDPTRFRLDYKIVEKVPVTGFVLADGKSKRRVLTDGSPGVAVGVKDRLPEGKLSGDQLFAQWTKSFSRLMFLSLTDGTDAWSPVVAKLAQPNSGYKTVLEERVLPYKQEMIKSYRVHAVRSADAAKKLGRFELEMIVDHRRLLPVTVRIVSTTVKGKTSQVVWSCRWAFNKKFPDKDFSGAFGPDTKQP